MMTNPDLGSEVESFTAKTETLLPACFTNVSNPTIEPSGDRLIMKIDAGLSQRDRDVAVLSVRQRFCLDSSNTYLAVEQSGFKVTATIDRTPIVRYDYDRDARAKPCSHLQIHAHRGALSHVLSQNGHPEPHALEALHFPTGGPRFRPCLEDFAEFLIRDCRFDAKSTWRPAVDEGRERWRRLQVRAVVRDVPSEAVAVLERLGYAVVPPERGDAPGKPKALHMW